MFARSLLVALVGLAIGSHAAPAPNTSRRTVPEKRQQANVYSSCTQPGQVALTFDDGPYIYHRAISDALTNAGALGTFFMNGNNWDCIYDTDRISDVQYAYNAGHQVGSHTWSHGDLTTFSEDQISDGMYRMEEAFSRILGVLPAFMRPPYGSINSNVLSVAYQRGQSIVTWDTDTGDSDGASPQQSEEVYASAVNSHVRNMLVLNHETYETTVDQVLPYAINLLQSNGYQLVTLSTCLGLAPYTAYGSPQANTGWTCEGTPEPGAGCSGDCETGSVYLQGGSSGGGGSTPPVPTGNTIRPGNAGSMCLTAASNTDGAQVSIQPCSGSTSQQWSYTGPGPLSIFGGAKCLDVPNGNTANGQKMQIWTCYGGNTNQEWYVTNDNRIAWENHGECLDLTNGVTSAGNLIQVWGCTDNDAYQVWDFV